MRKDKEKEKIIKRYFNRLRKKVPLDENIKFKIEYDEIWKYYKVSMYIPYKLHIGTTIVNYKEYLRIKRLLNIT